MSILSKITGEDFLSIEKRFEGRGYGEFKKEVGEVVATLLADIQARYNYYNNTERLNEILSQGAKKAQTQASETLNKAKVALGLN